jgi:hypothetical protein
MEDDLIREVIHGVRVGPDCALGSRTRWSSSVTVAKWNQSAEDLTWDHYHGGDFNFFACRDSLSMRRVRSLRRG